MITNDSQPFSNQLLCLHSVDLHSVVHHPKPACMKLYSLSSLPNKWPYVLMYVKTTTIIKNTTSCKHHNVSTYDYVCVACLGMHSMRQHQFRLSTFIGDHSLDIGK